MTDREIIELIKKNPNPIVTRAYHMGLIDKALEISKALEKFEYLRTN